MANPQGELYTIIAFDPNGKPVALRVNASNELMAVVSGGSGSGSPAEAQGKLVTPVVFDPDSKPVGLEVDQYGQLKMVVEGFVTAYTEGALVYNNANITIPTGTWTALTFNSEYYDTDTIHSTVSNTSRLTCKTAGKYLIVGTFYWAQSAAGAVRAGLIYLNRTVSIGYDEKFGGNVALIPACVAVAIKDLSVNDYVELWVKQDTGGDLLIGYTAEYSPNFMMQRIG